MADYVRVPETNWQDICDAVREQTGGEEKLLSGEVAAAVKSIESGGGDTDKIAAMLQTTFTEYSSDDVTAITSPSFYGQAQLAKVSLPNCTNVCAQAFYGCTALSSVNLPKTKATEHNTFRNCSALTEVHFPGHSGRIDSSAFEGCTNLVLADFAEVTVNPAIAGYSFGSCALTALIIRNTDSVPALGATTALYNTPIANGAGYIYVAFALIEDYKAATNWATFADQFRALEDYTVDGTVSGDLDMDKVNAAEEEATE